MKPTALVILLVFSASTSYAQCKVRSDKVDEFTGKRTILLKEDRMGNSIVFIYKSDSSYYVTFWAGEIGCAVTGKSKVLLKMADDSIIELPHVGKLNCKTSPLITINVSLYFDELTTLEVTKIRFQGSRGTSDVDVNKNPDLIQNGLLCLAKM